LSLNKARKKLNYKNIFNSILARSMARLRDFAKAPRNLQKREYITRMAKAPVKREDSDTGVITKTRSKTQKPSMYKVLLLNDDYTPMEFVVHVLEVFFNKSVEDAHRIMLHVH
jgi:hypothetical protein